MTQTELGVFYVSDRTGITVEVLARALLSQFDGLAYEVQRHPFCDTPEAIARVVEAAAAQAQPPLIFSTLVDPRLRRQLTNAQGLVLDFFDRCLAPLEQRLGRESNHSLGRSHGLVDASHYDLRMDAVNFSLSTDDGLAHQRYDHADLIIVGLSRSGKTPTCLYLALQYGVRAANYPLTDEDLEHRRLPDVLIRHRDKLFGLTIAPERLAEIREQRRPGSDYARLARCRYETRQLAALFQRLTLPHLDATRISVEEIATQIMHRQALPRR